MNLIVVHIFILLLIQLNASTDIFSSKHAVIFTYPNLNPTNSYFGFALQLQTSKDAEKNRLLVGAPNVNTIFSCLLNSKKCTEMELDRRGYNLTQSWFASSFDGSNQVNGNLMICAPRWTTLVNFSNSFFNKQNGLCFFFKNGSKFSNQEIGLTPLLNHALEFEDGGYNYIFGQAGSSIHYNEETKSFLLGATGLRNWTGSVVNYKNLDSEIEVNPTIVNPKRKHHKVPNYSYFGYAVSSGKFTRLNSSLYVAGAPRANNLKGMVYIFDLPFKNHHPFLFRYVLNGTKFGEYFGSALAVADINGDGLDDIIIGAPMYFTDKHPDIGRVYVYMSEENGEEIQFSSSPAQLIINFDSDKEIQNARFGSAISSLGDINKDGYEDIIIGAPYYNNKTGALYIYLGSKSGLSNNYAQRILASDISSSLRGFGYSFSKPLDIDGNFHNDIAVGAYLSGHAILLKSRPTVKIITHLTSNIRTFSRDTKEFNITSCFKYSCTEVPTTLKATTYISASNKIINILNPSYEFEYKKNEEYCRDISVKLLFETDKDIEIKMSYKIKENLQTEFCPLCPIVEEEDSVKSITISFLECDGPKCKPDLEIDAKFRYNKNNFPIKSSTELIVDITISNSGHTAFSPQLSIKYPRQMIFLEIPSNCQERKEIICTFGKQLNYNRQDTLTINLDVSQLTINDELFLELSTWSSVDDLNDNNNHYKLSLILYEDTNITIMGKSSPDEIQHYNLINETFFITYEFIIQNVGLSPLEQLTFEKSVPTNFPFIKDEAAKELNQKMIVPQLNHTQRQLILFCDDCTETIYKNVKLQKQGHQTVAIKLEIDTNELDAFNGNQDIVCIIVTLIVKSHYSDIIFSKSLDAKIIYEKQIASTFMWTLIGTVIGFICIIILFLFLFKFNFFKRNVYEKLEKEENNPDDNMDNEVEKQDTIGEEKIEENAEVHQF